MKGFEELDAWRKAHELVLAMYRVAGQLPKEERFGVVSQLRRAASCIPAKIAEGFGRRSTRDFLRYLEIEGGSLEETRYFLRLSTDLHYLEGIEFKSLSGSCDKVGRLLGGPALALRKRLV